MNTATDKLPAVATNHPNRSSKKTGRGDNPPPAKVKQLREGAGLTQEAFGALVYKGYRVVQEWESEDGRRRCPPDTFELLEVKIKARELMKRGRIAPQAVKDLGLNIPELE